MDPANRVSPASTTSVPSVVGAEQHRPRRVARRVLHPQLHARRCPARPRRPARAPRAARAARSGRRRTRPPPGTGPSSGRPAWPGPPGGSRPARRARRRPGTTLKVWSKWPWVSSTASGVSRCSASTASSGSHGVLAGVDDQARPRPGRWPRRSSWSGRNRPEILRRAPDQGRRPSGVRSVTVVILPCDLRCRIRSTPRGEDGECGGDQPDAARGGQAQAGATAGATGPAGQAPAADRADHVGRRGGGRGRRVRAADLAGRRRRRARGRAQQCAAPTPTAEPAAAPGTCAFTPTPNEPAAKPAPVPTVTTAPTSGTVRGDLQTSSGPIPLTLDRAQAPVHRGELPEPGRTPATTTTPRATG